MSEFTVCVPGHNPHYRCFNELAVSIGWALQQLGHVALRDTRPRPGARTIYLGCPEDAPAADAIFYNGEQVSRDSFWQHNALYAYYKDRTVWDYSATNAARYEQYGLPKPPVVRPGYCPLLAHCSRIEDLAKAGAKSYDVAFFGSMNDRREHVLREVEALGLSLLRMPFGVYGAERDTLLAQAKLCLNIHFYQSAIFESVRCAPLAMSGLPVLSEASADDEGDAYGMRGAAYSELPSRILELVRSTAALTELAELQSASVKNISMVDQIGEALERLSSADVGRVALGWVPGRTQRTSVAITLCMIVKDEKDVIERCLASVKPLISRWCIVDTGSTDGTQDIIRQCLQGIPGQLHERLWKEFDGSRNEAIDLARAECQEEGWLMMFDADEWVELDGELELPDGYDCYDGWITRCAGCSPWKRPLFMRANKPWFFEMPRHEGLYCRVHAPTAPAPARSLTVISSVQGARAKEGERQRFLRDAQVLEAWLPHHPGHSRCVFYIAQSYNWAATATDPPDRELTQKAIQHYLRRAEMPNDHPKETFSACYLAGQCMVRMGYPWERIQHTFLRAYALGTSRAEPLYNIARYYRESGDTERQAGRPSAGQYALAELFARKAVLIGPSEDGSADVDHSVNDWRAKDELATALTYLSGHAEARDLYRHILRQDLAPHERLRIEANLEMCKRLAPDPA